MDNIILVTAAEGRRVVTPRGGDVPKAPFKVNKADPYWARALRSGDIRVAPQAEPAATPNTLAHTLAHTLANKPANKPATAPAAPAAPAVPADATPAAAKKEDQ